MKLASEPKKIICSNPDSIFRYFAWPSVAKLPDGSLAMTASGFRLKHICPFGKAVICYSRDEGKSWTRPAAVIDTPLDDRDAGVVPFADGRVIVTSFNNTIAQQRKWNTISEGEHQWESLVRHDLAEAYLNAAEALGNESEFLGSTYKISDDGGYTFGPFKRSALTAPHGPMRMNDGSLMYVGRRFSADNSVDDGKDPFVQTYKLDKNDDFVPFGTIENIYHEDGTLLLSCEPHAIQLPSGKIITHIRVQGKINSGERIFTVYQAESYDGGKTFTKPHRLLTEKGGSPAHLILHSSGVLVSVYGYREAPYGIRAMFSKDEGETWLTDCILDDECAGPDLGYPASVELADGRILTVYYQNIDGESVIMQRVWELPKSI